MKELLKTALAEYGVTEKKASATHHPRILQYAKDIGHRWIRDDETAWCSIFANWVALKAGHVSSGKLNARSWLKTGVKTRFPEPGDVVIFWREQPDSWKGHVGFFIAFSEDKKEIYCLGGNQDNKVCIKTYPADRLLGFRRLPMLRESHT